LIGTNLTNADCDHTWFDSADLSSANLTKANLEWARLGSANLTNANLSQANLQALFFSTTLTGANFTDASIIGAFFSDVTSRGFTADQLYSTASYKHKELNELHLQNNNMSGWNFSYQKMPCATLYYSALNNADFKHANLSYTAFYGSDLSNANFNHADLTDSLLENVDLTNTNFTDSIVKGLYLYENSAFTKEQLYSTASYKSYKDLSGITLSGMNISGWNFAGQNLTNSTFSQVTSSVVDFSCADTRGASSLPSYGMIKSNMIKPDGTIEGLDLSSGRTLPIRNYNGNPRLSSSSPLPITIQNGMNMGTSGKLQVIMDNDDWYSTISFQAGIPVTLGGTLELGFAPGVFTQNLLGRSVKLFDWTGVTRTGTFTINSQYTWDTSKLYDTGEATMIYDPTLADTRWTGAVNGKWSNPGNWTNGTPECGSVIEFNGIAPVNQPIIQNIESYLCLNGIIFAPSAGTHFLGGSVISLSGYSNGIACASAADQYITNELWTSDTGIVVSGSGSLYLLGAVEGEGKLWIVGSGELVLENSAYADEIEVKDGTLTLDTTGDIECDSFENDGTFKILAGSHYVSEITGDGTTEIIAGTLTADSIVQSSLIIGGGATDDNSEQSEGPLSNKIIPVPEPGAIVLLAMGLLSLLTLSCIRR
jgi:uncharacterized protein YjbI with pentapeptide repeats